MRRFLVILLGLCVLGAFSGCIHHLARHHRDSPVKTFLKKRHAVHTGQSAGN